MTGATLALEVSPPADSNTQTIENYYGKCEEDQEAPLQSEVHPLLIEHILDRIFKYVMEPFTARPQESERSSAAAKDVQCIRLVCRLWYDRGTYLFRKSRPPTRFGAIFDKKRSSDLRMTNFLDALKSGTAIPIQRYVIMESMFSLQNHTLLQDFMEICTPTAVDLHLSVGDLSSLHLSRRNCSTLNLEKLRRLKIDCQQFRRHYSLPGPDNENICAPHLIELFLTCAENLRDLSFSISRCEREEADIIMGEVCQRIPENVRILELGELLFTDLHFTILADRRLPLEQLTLSCIEHDCSPNGIAPFFKRLSATLKTFSVFGNSSTLISKNFPEMKSLLHLHIEGTISNPIPFPFIFPNLQVLNIAQLKSETDLQNLLSGEWIAPSVVELHLPHRFPLAPLTKRLAQCFPFVERLYLSATPKFGDTLQEMFLHFSETTELFISFSTAMAAQMNGDSLFSGIPKAECKLDRIHSATPPDGKSSVLMMTQLRKIVLSGMMRDDKPSIVFNDFSAHFLFLKMDSLQELHVDHLRMSPETLGLLRSKLKIFRVKVIENSD